MRYVFVRPQEEHVSYVQNHLREQDRREIVAFRGYFPPEAVAQAVGCSSRSWCVLRSNDAWLPSVSSESAGTNGKCSARAGYAQHQVNTGASGAPFQVLGIFGVAPVGNNTGSPWFLGTEAVSKERRAFVHHSRRYVERMKEGFSSLQNVVDARNSVSLNWLRWCGFSIESSPVFCGPFRMPFYRFSLSA